MMNYYELLNIAADASAEAIQMAIDARYNEWRQSATHPDPVVVEEANRKLRLLEKARSTLMDPAKRADYDTSLDIGRVGGLADPTAAPRQNPPPPPRPKTPPSGKAETTALWACPKCGTDNPEWTQFCLNCRAELVRLCPECGQMKSLVKTGACGNCGFEYLAAKRRVELHNEIESLSRQQGDCQMKIANLQTQLSSLGSTERAKTVRLRFLAVNLFVLPGVCGLALFSGSSYDEIIGSTPAYLYYLLLWLLINLLALFNARKGHRAALSKETEYRQSIATLQEEIANLQAQIDQFTIEYDRIGRAKALE
jgi:hypothetical protein